MLDHQTSSSKQTHLERLKNIKPLSSREKEILLLITYCNTNQEIADKLFLAKGTIATHRNNLLAKLNVKNTAGIVRKAFELSILILNNEGVLEINHA